MAKQNDLAPLTPAVFYILLALYGKERHGYDIMGQASDDSNGKVVMGPGTLYGSLDRMMDAGLVDRSTRKNSDPRRIYYRLTGEGKKVLQAEVDRMSVATKIAAARHVMAI